MRILIRILTLFVVTSLVIGGEIDPNQLRIEGIEALKRSETDQNAIMIAADKFARAALVYESKKDEVKAVEMNSFLYWCKKKMTAQNINMFLTTKEKASTKKLESIDKPIEKSEADKFFERADKFATGNPNEYFAIAVRYFEVADRFVGTEISLKAQKKSLEAQQKSLNKTVTIPNISGDYVEFYSGKKGPKTKIILNKAIYNDLIGVIEIQDEDIIINWSNKQIYKFRLKENGDLIGSNPTWKDSKVEWVKTYIKVPEK